MSVTYMLAADAAIVLNYGTANQAVVAGLNKLSLPGGTREVVTVDEFRNEWSRQFTAAGKYNDLTFGGQYALNDVLGQDVLKAAWKTRRVFQGDECRCYLNYSDFFTTDLANDPSSGLQVADIGSGETDKSGIFPLNGKFVPNGALAIYSAHIEEEGASTLAFTDGATPTVTDSAERFVANNFRVGQTLLISGSTSNDGVAALITSVAVGVLELDVKIGTVVAETGAADMEIHGGSF